MNKSFLALAAMLLAGSLGPAGSADASELRTLRGERDALRSQEVSAPVASDERLTARRTHGDGALSDGRDQALTIIRPGGLALKAESVLTDPLAALKGDIGQRRGLSFEYLTYSDDSNRFVIPSDTPMQLIDTLNKKRRAVRNGLAFQPVLFDVNDRESAK